MRHRFLGICVVALAQLGCGGDSNGTGPSGASGSSGAPGASGSSGAAGTTGSGGSTPGGGGTSALPDDGTVPPATALTKLDLLLMIDNSRGMNEKQRLLSEALNGLLDDVTTNLGITDIQIGVITSSLGSHGNAEMRGVCIQPRDNDHAQLIGVMRGVPTWNNSGFLRWDPAQAAVPPGTPVLADLEQSVLSLVASAGDQGCGYEASLEAWYRFLVDPEPPLAVVIPVNGAVAEPQGVDETLLAQRKAFLRPDSALGIVLLTDENDCSIVDRGYGWMLTRIGPMTMYRGTSQCDTDPNSACCQSCGEVQPKTGCPAIESDAKCAENKYFPDALDDSLNLRCFAQKRRFGLDLLYPISRYTDALTRQSVLNRAGQPVPNPLFAGAGTKRHPSQVVYTGIVGVPWQDLADDASLTGTGLTYLTAAQLNAAQRWPLMLGDSSASPPTLPTDPFMVESIDDRSTLGLPPHPLTGQSPVANTSTDPKATINGHEEVVLRRDTLQAACIFELSNPIECDAAAQSSNASCLCFEGDLPDNAAVCQPPTGGPATTLQYSSAALPGVRHLELMRSLGDNAIVASVCPKVMDESAPDYGYRPAMRAFATRLSSAFNP